MRRNVWQLLGGGVGKGLLSAHASLILKRGAGEHAGSNRWHIVLKSGGLHLKACNRPWNLACALRVHWGWVQGGAAALPRLCAIPGHCLPTAARRLSGKHAAAPPPPCAHAARR